MWRLWEMPDTNDMQPEWSINRPDCSIRPVALPGSDVVDGGNNFIANQ